MAQVSLVGAPLVLAALVSSCARSDSSGASEARKLDSAATAARPTERRVSNVMIGKALGAGNHITEPTFQFAPQDTVYVSVGTTGSVGATTLTTAWRSQTGEILLQATEPVRPGENAAFRLAQPKGFKPGTYKAVVFLGNDSADTKVFMVKK